MGCALPEPSEERQSAGKTKEANWEILLAPSFFGEYNRDYADRLNQPKEYLSDQASQRGLLNGKAPEVFVGNGFIRSAAPDDHKALLNGISYAFFGVSPFNQPV